MKFGGWAVVCWLLMGSVGWANVGLSSQPRPEDGIYDPGNRISPAEKSALRRDIESTRENGGLDLLVAVIEKPGTREPQDVADELANRWGYHGGRALVLWIPEAEGSPWISIGGLIRSEMPAAALQTVKANAKRRAGVESSLERGVRAAVSALSEDLRFAGGQAARGTANAPKYALPNWKEVLITAAIHSKKLVILGGVGLATVIFLIYHVWKIWKRARMLMVPKKFPEVSWKRRFGAPHAGIVYSYSNPRNFTHHAQK